jgi:hypothetical protein
MQVCIVRLIFSSITVRVGVNIFSPCFERQNLLFSFHSMAFSGTLQSGISLVGVRGNAYIPEEIMDI